MVKKTSFKNLVNSLFSGQFLAISVPSLARKIVKISRKTTMKSVRSISPGIEMFCTLTVIYKQHQEKVRLKEFDDSKNNSEITHQTTLNRDWTACFAFVEEFFGIAFFSWAATKFDSVCHWLIAATWKVFGFSHTKTTDRKNLVALRVYLHQTLV